MGSRSFRPTQAAAAVTALLLFLAASLLVLVPPAAAASSVVPKDAAIGGNIVGEWNGATRNYWAGLIGVDTDGNGSVDAYAYCIDLGTHLVIDRAHEEGTWDAANVPNLGEITWILHNYPASSNTPVATAKAVQAAIWHFSDGFDLTTTGPQNSAEVIALYQSILDNAVAVPEPQPTLQITPTPQTVDQGTGVVFEVTTTSPGPVALTLTGAPAGARIVAASNGVCDTQGPAITQVAANAEVCVVSSIAGGPAVLHGEVEEATATGRVFLREGSQKLIFAGGGSVSAVADAEATWVVPTTTTTTTAPTTTTTTAAPTTTTTAAPTTTTTSGAEVLGEVQTTSTTAGAAVLDDAELPTTGSDPSGMVAAGLAVLVGGALLVGLARAKGRNLSEQ
jgi:TQXA domain-containing protein/LPXTG-motif cell wall-anchored protein